MYMYILRHDPQLALLMWTLNDKKFHKLLTDDPDQTWRDEEPYCRIPPGFRNDPDILDPPSISSDESEDEAAKPSRKRKVDDVDATAENHPKKKQSPPKSNPTPKPSKPTPKPSTTTPNVDDDAKAVDDDDAKCDDEAVE